MIWKRGKALVTEPKEMEISNLPEKMIISKKLSKVQEQRQLNGIRETIHLKNEKFNRNHKKTTPGAEEYKMLTLLNILLSAKQLPFPH